MTQLEQAIETIKDWERDIRFPNDDREAIRKDTLCEVLDYLTSLPSLPEGLDVSDFCKPIPKEIANKMPEVIDECIWGKKDQQGLNEAVEEYAPDFSNDFASKAAVEAVRDAFRAGAKWQAGQGETHELRVESPLLGPPMICCPVDAKNGDIVIVQIRRINEKEK